IDSEDEIEFFVGSPSYPEVETFNPSLDEVQAEDFIKAAMEFEQAALEADSRVDLVNWALSGYYSSEVFIANTQGLEQSYRRNFAYGYLSAVIKEEGQIKTGSKAKAVYHWDQFKPGELAREAVLEGVSLLNADTVPSGDYKIILRRD